MPDWAWGIVFALGYGAAWVGLFFVAIFCLNEIDRDLDRKEAARRAVLDRRAAERLAKWREGP